MNEERYINVLKAIGIISVVCGHLFEECRWMFMYHMPLFFILSGYTFKPNKYSFGDFVKKKFRHLIIPYFSYFLLILVLNSLIHPLPLREFLRSFLLPVYGGQKMAGIYGVFWFINVYFLGIITFKVLFEKIKQWTLLLIFVLSYVLAGFQNVPWNIQVVPMAISYMCIGILLQKCKTYLLELKRECVYLGIAALLGVPFIPKALLIDMKTADYGVPLISFVVSVLIVILLLVMSYRLAKRFDYGGGDLMGKSSMVIMYLHQFIHFTFQERIPNLIILMLCILLPLMFEKLIVRNKILSLYFLGK